jgi:Sec-independent protein translocase protein TatA
MMQKLTLLGRILLSSVHHLRQLVEDEDANELEQDELKRDDLKQDELEQNDTEKENNMVD